MTGETRTLDAQDRAATARNGSGRHLHVLDYLRFVAAAVVLAFHYTFNGINNGKIASLDTYWPITPVTQYGYLGVDLFFLISGFVILNSARNKTARQFAVGRAVRLYPAFWAAVLVTAAVTVAFGHVNGLTVTPKQVAINLTMVPSLLGAPLVDGVYWTLLFELEFYALVFLLLLAGQGRRLGAFLPWWAFGMLAVSLIVPQYAGLPGLGGYFALFAGGALIAEIRHHGPSVLRVAGLVASAATALPHAARHAHELEVATRVDFSETTAAVLVGVCYLAILSMCLPRVAAVRLPAAVLLGALTYPLYLVHAHIGYMMLSLFATEQNRLWVYPMVIAGVLGLAYGLHVLVERRPKAFWFRIFDGTVGRAVGAVTPTRGGRHRPVRPTPTR
ncbi:MAG: acyltransferase [Hamadaea sp.]|nr:acyltransferase [Hamadaea sp.]